MVFEPSILLMDEPLGALDRKLREQIMRLHLDELCAIGGIEAWGAVGDG